MSFDPGLELMEAIDNKKLCEIFKCSPQGRNEKIKLH